MRTHAPCLWAELCRAIDRDVKLFQKHYADRLGGQANLKSSNSGLRISFLPVIVGSAGRSLSIEFFGDDPRIDVTQSDSSGQKRIGELRFAVHDPADTLCLLMDGKPLMVDAAARLLLEGFLFLPISPQAS